MATIAVDQLGNGATLVTSDRPERRKALSHELVADLHLVLDDLKTDRECRIVIVTGAGTAFCAGFDLIDPGESQEASGFTGPVRGMIAQQSIGRLITRIRELPQPVIVAMGGGFALALAADIRLAAESAYFSIANVAVGLSGADIGISYLLPRMVGPRVPSS